MVLYLIGNIDLHQIHHQAMLLCAKIQKKSCQCRWKLNLLSCLSKCHLDLIWVKLIKEKINVPVGVRKRQRDPTFRVRPKMFEGITFIYIQQVFKMCHSPKDQGAYNICDVRTEKESRSNKAIWVVILIVSSVGYKIYPQKQTFLGLESNKTKELHGLLKRPVNPTQGLHGMLLPLVTLTTLFSISFV